MSIFESNGQEWPFQHYVLVGKGEGILQSNSASAKRVNVEGNGGHVASWIEKKNVVFNAKKPASVMREICVREDWGEGKIRNDPVILFCPGIADSNYAASVLGTVRKIVEPFWVQLIELLFIIPDDIIVLRKFLFQFHASFMFCAGFKVGCG
jgi:hypothetical protein